MPRSIMVQPKSQFWTWNQYMLFIFLLCCFNGSTNYLFGKYAEYVALLGLTSAMIEATLGMPQFYLNCKR